MQKNLANVDVDVAQQESVLDGTVLLKKPIKTGLKNISPEKLILVEKPWWTEVSNTGQIVAVDWNKGIEVAYGWNEACAKVVAVFGLPGERFYYRPKEEFMIFVFKSVKDAKLCRILLSEII